MLAVAQKLYLLRTRKGITQTELSNRSRIPQANLSKIEQGKQDPTISTLVRISLALGITPAEFFGKEPERKPFRWTRRSLERVAQAVTGDPKTLSDEEKEIVELLKDTLPGPWRKRLSSRRIYQSWYELKGKLSQQEIRTLAERVQDATERMEAKQEKDYQELLANFRRSLGRP